MTKLVHILATKFNKYTNTHTMASIIVVSLFFIVDIGSIAILWSINYNKYNILIFILCVLFLLSYYFFIICIKISDVNNAVLDAFNDILLVLSASSIVSSILGTSWSSIIDGITLFIYLIEDIVVSSVYIFDNKNNLEADKMGNNSNKDLNERIKMLLNDKIINSAQSYINSQNDTVKQFAKSIVDNIINNYKNRKNINNFNNLIDKLKNKRYKNRDELVERLKRMFKNK